MKLLLASGNAKKLRELVALFDGEGVEVVTPADVGGLPEVIEDRDTFAGNAAKKATSGAQASGLWTLADDSGLEVDALGGAPGVYSARYAGEPCDDAKNNAKLLEELRDVAPAERGARFVCALAVARPDGEVVIEIRGEARGRILSEARGGDGFGYDPLFLFDEPDQPGTGHAFAELSRDEKAAVSHRGRALARLVAPLSELLTRHAGIDS